MSNTLTAVLKGPPPEVGCTSLQLTHLATESRGRFSGRTSKPMCGIAGVVGRRTDPELLRRMGSTISHRGPDGGRQLVDEKVGFAFQRLSIIDLAGGQQPIFNEDGSVALMLNGEIYNHRELRRGLEERGHSFSTNCDVEVVLHLWEEMGTDCLRPLRGMFAMAIWDARAQSLFLARDRVGKKPLYYHRLADGSLVFGSEIKAILQHPEVPRSPDPTAIDQFLVLGYVPSGMSAFKGIERLKPAHWMLWENGRTQVQRYWRLDFGRKISAAPEEIRQEIWRLLKEAVTIRLESEVPLGAFLSGGVDSSAVVGLAAQALGRPLKTFSIGFETAAFDESAYARLVSQKFQTDHHELILREASADLIQSIVWHHDQPFGDSSAIPSFELARLTRPHVTVVLNGDGGDESFAGYRRYGLGAFAGYFALPGVLRQSLAAGAGPVTELLKWGRRAAPLLGCDPIEAYFLLLTHLAPGRRAGLYSNHFLAQLGEASYPPLDVMRDRFHPSLLDAYQDADVNSYLPDDLLVKMDVATMAHSLEARSPLLDQELMEFVGGVPASAKLAGGHPKALLKSVLQDFLPPEVLARRKMGFGVPLGQWLRTGLKEQLTDALLAPSARQREYFRAGRVEEMVWSVLRGDDLYQSQLWDLLMLELWHQTYIDSPNRAGEREDTATAVEVAAWVQSADDDHSRPVTAR
jgi:asparagine synthase (glutamine-hydrolysing)